MNISFLNRPPRHAEEKRFDEPLPFTAGEATGIAVRVRERLWHQMAHECEAMAQHALGTGVVVPADVIEHLDQAVSVPDGPIARPEPPPADGAARTSSTVESSRFGLLASAHAGLALAIAPATPEAVLLMAEERARHPFWSEFGPLPLVRQMLAFTMMSLALLLGVSTSAVVNTGNMSKSLLELSGYPLFMIEAFLVSAASLGSCFANLQRINTVISDGTYDPRVQSTYWTRWVMGVISGVVLSQIVYDLFLTHSGDDATVRTVPPAIGQPILALLGGYSIDFVHGILKRAIHTVADFFGVSMGEPDNQPRPGRAKAVAQQRLALASIGQERAPAAGPEIEDLAGRANALVQPITPKTN
jgi:hypothetical protein